MIPFPPSLPNENLLKKAVNWSLRNQDHAPNLSELERRSGLEERPQIGEAWQKAGLGRVITSGDNGHHSVVFAFNDQAVLTVRQINQQMFFGRLKVVNRSDWIAILSLIVAAIALLKPSS